MARKLDGNYITANTITTTQLTTTVVSQISAGGGPKVTTITYPNSATAAVNTGNESIVLTGTGFESGVQVYINGAAAPSVSRTNSTSLSFTTPALSTGTTYPLYVVNPDGGTAVVVPGMVVSSGPVWVTGTPLTGWGATSSLSRTLVATSDSTISYSLADGSSLPSGLSLAANGLLSGTLTSPPASKTTYNFTVVATDLELQKSSKAFSINATVGLEATGGTISNISGYTVHTFTSSGSFEVTSGTGTVEYLVIGGGGGGGSGSGGGGGAGGYRTGASYSVSAGNVYTVTVGAGGSGGAGSPGFADNGRGANGSSSVFDTITSAGGGGGGGRANTAGKSGGSGGGGSGGTRGFGNTPSTSPSQGNNGADSEGIRDGFSSGAGGGGAGTVGGAGYYDPSQASIAGNGGAGLASTITGTSVTRAGGGGGGGWNVGPGCCGAGATGSGGSGGGGNGRTSPTVGISGTVNTGGGGGGTGYPYPATPAYSSVDGGSGGSGIVIIRYAA